MKNDTKEQLHNKNEIYSSISVCIDNFSKEFWTLKLLEFKDANLSQTWEWGDIMYGPQNVSRMIIMFHNEAIAMAQIRIRYFSMLKLGLGTIHRGPLWCKKGRDSEIVNLEVCLNTIKEEYTNSFSVDRWTNLVHKLSDYFEKEAQNTFEGKDYCPNCSDEKISFNQQQFLKDCGVVLK